MPENDPQGPKPEAASAGDRAPETIPGPPPAVTGPGRLADLDPRVPLTAEELAAIMGVHVKTIHRAAHKGELPLPFRFLGRQRWTAGAILDHLARRQAAAIS
jgi:excisionase family DNA binding protein